MRVAIILSALAGTLLLGLPAIASPHYQITILPSADGHPSGYAINNPGQVVGSQRSGCCDQTAWLWDGAGGHAIAPTDPLSSAGAINDAGAVVVNYEDHTYLYDETLHGIGPSNGGTYGAGINDTGEVVGYATTEDGHTASFLYDGTSFTTLALGESETGSSASDINNLGQITGYLTTDDWNTTIPFVYDGTSTILLGSLGGSGGYSTAINDSGEVVGSSNTADDATTHAFLYRDGVMQDLGSMGYDYSGASAINAQGDVVGNLANYGGAGAGTSAFLYSGGVMHDLNAFIDPSLDFRITGASGINDRGQILVSGFTHNGSALYLLTPVPEPASWATMSIGFWLIGAARRRQIRAVA